MPLSEIAAAQPAFQSHLGTLRYQTLFHGKVFSSSFTVENENRLTYPWKSFDTHKRVKFSKMPWRRLMINAVATLEPKSIVQNEYEHKGHINSQLGIDSSSWSIELQSSSEDSDELSKRERLRRMRISKANKGNTAWNKGRKHSPETLQRIRERTRLAMQDPKVRMKLVTFGHAQSDETKLKIGVGVRIGWQRRREKLMLQEMCYFEWLNLISEASRRGYVDDEDELQWDSYKILKEQFEKEWTGSVEERKKMPKLKGNRRGPKSPEQRRKISEAISAKWTNPEYRKRVWSGQAKYHGIPEGAERKPRRTSGSTQSTSRGLIKKNAIRDCYFESETTSQNQQTRLGRNAPLYKDPLASSKFEMIKNIRVQRAAAETKKTEAIERARMLIAEAEKAANALEVAATKSPIAQAALMETRKLIAEAVGSLESTETGQITSHETNRYPSPLSSEQLNQTQNQEEQRKVNGTKSLTGCDNDDFDFGKFTFQELRNGEAETLPTSSSDSESVLLPLNGNIQCGKNPIPNRAKVQYIQEETSSKSVTKKWVCGRLVEVTE